MQIIIRLISDCFKCQIHIAALDIDFDIFSQAWPILFFKKKLSSFIDTKITYKKVIIISTDKLEINDFWYIEEILIIKQPVEVFADFFQLLCNSDFLSLKVRFL